METKLWQVVVAAAAGTIVASLNWQHRSCARPAIAKRFEREKLNKSVHKREKGISRKRERMNDVGVT